MKLLGFEITRSRRKAAPPLAGVDGRGGWVTVFDHFRGAWQSHVEMDRDSVLAQTTVFACMTLIAADIAKLQLRLVERTPGGIWQPAESPAFGPVVRKPNHFQTRQQFVEGWLLSKLAHGNTYVLKQRDARRVVVRMYLLDPTRVQPLVAPDGSVFYQLHDDDLSGVPTGLPAVPASEIIHDRWNCLFHPLVGLSPIFACGLAATKALKIERNAAAFFQNMSRPSGILSAPAEISDETAVRLKAHWEQNFTAEKIGRIAVLGDGLKYEAMTISATDSQLVEQLKMSAEQVCSAFHVPAYMVGAAPAPAYNNVQALNQQYYSQCLQSPIEALEACLDEGLGLGMVDGRELATMFDIDDLLRMDTATMTASLRDQVGSGIASPDEARRRLNLPPVPGGATPYLQQQNYSLAALARRDAQDNPFGPAAPPPQQDDDAEEMPADDQARAFVYGYLKQKALAA
jgi:HK97 family phage portal protein